MYIASKVGCNGVTGNAHYFEWVKLWQALSYMKCYCNGWFGTRNAMKGLDFWKDLLKNLFRPIFLNQLFEADDISSVISFIKRVLQRSELLFSMII